MVDLAFKNLLHDRLRFATTLAGIAFSVTLVLSQLGLFFGLLKNASVTIENLPAEIWVNSKNTPSVDFGYAFPETYVQRIRSIPGVQKADNLIVFFTEIALPSGAREGLLLYALEDFEAWNFPWSIVEGNTDDLRRGRFMFLDESARIRYGAFQIGDYREVNGTRIQLVGTTHDARSFTTVPIAFMNYHLAQKVVPEFLAGRATNVIVKLKPGVDPVAMKKEIQRRLPFNDVYTKAEWIELSRSYWTDSTGLGLNAYLTVFLGCLVGVVVVGQTLYTATMEHLREFGTVKAIGGSNWDIYQVLVKQAVISALLGFLVGVIPAFIFQLLVPLVELKMIISLAMLGAVFCGTVLLCLASSLMSFQKVARIDPALVFRT